MHAIASSQPPPSANPLTAAMTGLPSRSMPSNNAWPAPRVLAAADRRLHGQFLDVGAGDERLLARAGQHDRAHAGVVARRVDGRVEFVQRLRRSARSGPAGD